MNNLITAYRQTHYRVFAPEGEFTLKIDTPSEELRDCHTRHNVESSAFITAWNPNSKPQCSILNHFAQLRLRADLRRAGKPTIPGRGDDPQGKWPGESSLLVLGVTEVEARRLGQKFGQLAVVFAEADAVPRLLLLQPSG